MSIESHSQPSHSHATQLKPDQTDQIARVKEFRREAESLRALTSSRGRYGPDEASRFWALLRNASFALHIANPELAERAGLGAGFFTSVVRDKRKPKLTNFLRALSVIIDVANERLKAVDYIEIAPPAKAETGEISSSISNEYEQILQLASSLAQMARQEITIIRSAPANHPETVDQQNRQIELLEIFANGFDKISKALAKFAARPQNQSSLVSAQKAAAEVGNQLDLWWAKNADQAIDWAIRIPVIVGGIAALGWAGANMAVGTTVIAALVGGPKVAEVMRKRKQKK